jgi:predicted transcriptional regulator
LRSYRLMEYLCGMKVKTSITLSRTTLHAIDEIAGPEATRSRIIENAVLDFVERHRRRVREAKDLEILNRAADRLNRETEDVLPFQVER